MKNYWWNRWRTRKSWIQTAFERGLRGYAREAGTMTPEPKPAAEPAVEPARESFPPVQPLGAEPWNRRSPSLH